MIPKTPNGHKILCITIYLLWFKIQFFVMRRYPRPIYMVLTQGTKQEHILLNLLCKDKMTVSDKYGFLTKDTYLTITSCFRAFWVNYISVIRINIFTSRVVLFFCSHTCVCCIYFLSPLLIYFTAWFFFCKNIKCLHFLKALHNVLLTWSILSLSERISYVSLELHLLWWMLFGAGGVITLSRMVLGVGAWE